MNWFRTTGLRLLLALGLAFSLWLYVTYRENPQRTTTFSNVPVQIENLAPDLVVVDQDGLPSEPDKVTVTVEADTNTLANVTASSFEALLDMAGRSSGDHNIPVDVRSIRSDLRRVTYTSDPTNLSLRVEQVVTSTIPLTVTVSGNVPFSFEQLPAETRVNGNQVATVEISGPQSQVAQVVQARATANIDRLTANYNSPRPIEPIDASGTLVRGVTITPTNVDVLVPIVSSIGIKRVPVVPQLTGQPAAGQIVTSVVVTPEFVSLTGSSGPLDQVELINTEPIDISGATGTITKTARLAAPAGVTLVAGEPITTSVRITTSAIERPFTVSLPVGIRVVNQGANLLLSTNTETVQVSLSGSANLLSRINNSTLQATIDLNGLGAGTYTVTPTFNVPDGITITNRPTVSVTLRAPALPTPSLEPTTVQTATSTPTGENEPAGSTATPEQPTPESTPEATAAPAAEETSPAVAPPTATPPAAVPPTATP